MKQKVRVEFHCHTIYSADSLTSIDKLLADCEKKGIDRLAITDHNSVAGAYRAYQLDHQRVIIGEEIKTTQGELLAFFVKEQVPKGLTPGEAIRRLRQQGAFISVSHPFDTARNGAWEKSALAEIASQVDAIEVFNSRCAGSMPNQAARIFAAENHLGGTVGSDAHILWEVGRATLMLNDFYDANELRQALEQAEPRLSYSPYWVHFASTWARLRKKAKSDHPLTV
jgi:predicted metal-dependent phosphoesterase TrpH